MPIARKSRSERNDLIITFHRNLFQVSVTFVLHISIIYYIYCNFYKLLTVIDFCVQTTQFWIVSLMNRHLLFMYWM